MTLFLQVSLAYFSLQLVFTIINSLTQYKSSSPFEVGVRLVFLIFQLNMTLWIIHLLRA